MQLATSPWHHVALIFAGTKMLVTGFYEDPVGIAMGMIILVLAAAISLLVLLSGRDLRGVDRYPQNAICTMINNNSRAN